MSLLSKHLDIFTIPYVTSSNIWHYHLAMAGLHIHNSVHIILICTLIDYMIAIFKAYCMGGSKCHALPLYAVKLTKVRAIFISPRMWLGQYDYCVAALAP